jgi:peptide-methionine (S)-S-oxide reductase
MRQLRIAILLSAAGAQIWARTIPDPIVDETQPASKRETAVLAGGCFWGVEAVFSHVKGVTEVVSGYSGGDKKSARMEIVESGRSKHAESVRVAYDPSKITYGRLLKVFFSVVHDPTQVNRQGPDVGTQYRSVIFYNSDQQRNIAEAYIRQLETSGFFARKIATEIAPLEGFFQAEEFLQRYSQRNLTNAYVIQYDVPRLEALKREFPELYRSK